MSFVRSTSDLRPGSRSVTTALLFLALGLFLIGHGGQALSTPPSEGTLHQVVLAAQVVAGACFLISVSIGLLRRGDTAST